MQVVKKTLFSLACKKAGIQIDVDKLEGQLAFVFAFEDEITPAKELYKFIEANKIGQILGGYVQGRMISAQEAVALAKLPSHQELLAKMVGSISAPLSGLINVLQGNIKGLLIVLSKAKQ